MRSQDALTMPIALKPPMRLATREDGRALAELINFAGEGLPMHFWSTLAVPGQDAWSIGTARAAEQADNGRVIVIDEGGGVAAAMMGYPVPDDPPPVDPKMPQMFRVLQELENKVPGTWYLNVLATYPRARGRGLGARLVRLAEDTARDQGLSGVSIIVADQNHGAMRLYERLGYREVKRAEMVKDEWESASEAWVLLLKETAP